MRQVYTIKDNRGAVGRDGRCYAGYPDHESWVILDGDGRVVGSYRQREDALGEVCRLDPVWGSFECLSTEAIDAANEERS